MARKRDDERTNEPGREGDILGLGGAAVPQTDEDRAIEGGSADPDEVRRRRERAGMSPDADDRTTTGSDELIKGKGATGIDMGAAGKGTGIRRDRRSS